MLNKKGLFLWLVLFFLAACAESGETAVKETTALAPKEVTVELNSTVTLAEILTGAIEEEEVGGATAVAAPTSQRSRTVAPVEVIVDEEAETETAAPQPTSEQSIGLLATFMVEDGNQVGGEGETAVNTSTVELTDSPAPTASNTQQVEQNSPSPDTEHLINAHEDADEAEDEDEDEDEHDGGDEHDDRDEHEDDDHDDEHEENDDD